MRRLGCEKRQGAGAVGLTMQTGSLSPRSTAYKQGLVIHPIPLPGGFGAGQVHRTCARGPA